MKILRMIGMVSAMFLLTACASHQIDAYEGMTPRADIQEYFTGPIKAWGIVQDRSGKVTRRFDVDMIGEWKGNTGTLTEYFDYYDGEKQKRVWTISKLDNGFYEGSASDILDTAKGQAKGNTLHWTYVMDVPVDDTTYRLRFDDWMWVMNDGVLINRSYLKKFGITVAEVTIFMQKQ